MTGAGSGGQGPADGADAEEAERCPICLGVLPGGELAMPDSCCHVFCLRCLLTWAEMAASCPVDRRPFSKVYRWDGSLSCVQVPVTKRPAEAESCCCRNPEQKVCLKSKPRRSRRQKAATSSDSKTKGLVRKCNDEDPSSLSRKKVRGTECRTWTPPPCVSLMTSTQEVADPVWLAEEEEEAYDTGLKQCKPQAQHCPWISPAAPVPASGASRQSFYGTSWNHSPSPSGLISSPFTPSPSFGPAHFVFQGVVCAITCPKGGDKRGGRGSASKAPTKEAESRPSRRSVRNKSQEEAPASDAASPPPPQSGVSDSDSSAGQPAKTSQVPAKRKGKRVTNRKASGKRKAPARKKRSAEVVSSPAASEEEEEEEEEGDKKEEKEEEKDEQEHLNLGEQQQSDANGSVKDDGDESDSADEPDGAAENEEGTQEPSDQDKQEDKSDDQVSSQSGSPPPSPLSSSGAPQSHKEEEEDEEEEEEEEEEEPPSPASPGDDSEDQTSTSPAAPEEPASARCDDQDSNMDVCEDSQEANEKDSSKEVVAESGRNEERVGSSSPGESEEKVAAEESKESKESEIPDVKMLDSEEHSGVESCKDDNSTKDDTSIVPMDCSSPTSEQDDNPGLEIPSESAAPQAAGATAAASESQVVPVENVSGGRVKDETAKDQLDREKSPERKNGKPRRSRFHSPTSTWSPKKDSKREPSRHSRSRSRERDGSPPSRRSSRARSKERERDRDGERDYSRRDRSRDRRRRRSRSRSRSRSHSRSRSRSRTRSYRRGPSPDRPASREHSPQRKERWGGWRSGPSGGSAGEGRRFQGGAGRFENGVPPESSPERQGWSENPDWVTEKTRAEPEGRNRDFGSSRWEDRGNRGEAWGRGGRGGFDAGRGGGRGGAGTRGFYNQQEDVSDSRWQPRNNFSGTGNTSGNDAYSRFNENRGGRRKDSEPGESMLDRSGWSSASSWAVRRTLPADVQDYYSKRERGGASSWNRQEEEQPAAASDPPKSEAPPLVVPGNAPVPVMNMIPPQLNVLHYPLPGPRGALPVSLQPAAPYAMPPQVPLHLHPAVPLLQVPAVGAQGLPPPPPPPPPMQQGSLTAAASQPDNHAAQMVSTVGGYGKPSLLPTPTKAMVAAISQGPAPSAQALPSSTTQHSQHSKAQADSSKKEKKQQIQEKAINEVKTAIKPYYQKKEITKEEYKEIVRKAVEKVCHSKSGEVNSGKVANLVKAYVDKYKHARKK